MGTMKSFRFKASTEYDLKMIMDKTGLNGTETVELALDVLSFMIGILESDDPDLDRLGGVAKLRIDRVLSK